jgi:hypothetical protein
MQDKDDGFFKGINPVDLLATGKKGVEANSRFECALKTLLRFNVHVEGMIKVLVHDQSKTRMFTLGKDT